MIPPLAALLEAHTLFVRGRRLRPQRDEARLAEALREALELCDGRPQDEPAALLFALSRRPRALGDAWDFPVVCARNLARSILSADLGCEDDDVDFVNLRLRLAAKQATFEETLAFLAARLRPIGS